MSNVLLEVCVGTAEYPDLKLCNTKGIFIVAPCILKIH